MRVGFLHVDIPGHEDMRRLAEIMVASVRKAMPDAEIVQLTELSTPPVEGVHSVIRRKMENPWLMHYRLDHFRNFPEGDAMFIDTDAVVQKDTSIVFEKTFDVALTKRTGVILVDGKNIVPEMPYNTGVMFTRNRAFWDDAYDYCSRLSEKERHWFGDQKAVRVVVESGKYNVLDVPCAEFNYSPARNDEDVSGKYVVHYKGKRKSWMLAKYMEVA